MLLLFLNDSLVHYAGFYVSTLDLEYVPSFFNGIMESLFRVDLKLIYVFKGLGSCLQGVGN